MVELVQITTLVHEKKFTTDKGNEPNCVLYRANTGDIRCTWPYSTSLYQPPSFLVHPNNLTEAQALAYSEAHLYDLFYIFTWISLRNEASAYKKQDQFCSSLNYVPISVHCL